MFGDNDWFEVTWHIKNFLMFPVKTSNEIISPAFTIYIFGNSEWKLAISPRFSETPGIMNFCCSLRCNKLGTLNNDTKGLIAFNISNAHEEKLECRINPGTVISTTYLSKDELFKLFLPNDTLTVSCYIKCQSTKCFPHAVSKEIGSALDRESKSSIYLKQLYELRMETVIVIETRRVSCSIEEFTSLPLNERFEFPLLSGVEGKPSFYVTLFRVDSDSVVAIEIRRKPNVQNVNCLVRCNASVLATVKSRESEAASMKSNEPEFTTTESNESMFVTTDSNISVYDTTVSNASVFYPMESNSFDVATMMGNESMLDTTRNTASMFSEICLESNESVYSTTISNASLLGTTESNRSMFATRHRNASESNTATSYAASVLPTTKDIAYKGEDLFWFFEYDEVWYFPGFLSAAEMVKDKYFEETAGTLHLKLIFTVSTDDLIHSETPGFCRHSEIHRTDVVHPSITQSSYVDTSEFVCTDEELSDVVLRTKDRDIKAHKCVLMGRSKVFETKFKSEMRERETGIVEVEDVDPETLKLMVDFLHSRNDLECLVPIENVITLHKAADKYQVPSLMWHCSFLLTKALDGSNVCKVLKFGDDYDHEWLVECATDYVVGNADSVLESREWRDIMETNASLAASIMRRMLLRN